MGAADRRLRPRPQARVEAVPAPPRGRRHAPADRAHRRADDGEPLVRRPPRDAAAQGDVAARSRRAAGQPQRQAAGRRNPDATGKPVRASHMPSIVPAQRPPGQDWNAQPHVVRQRAQRRLREGVQPTVAMGSGTTARLPFTYSLASVFPVGDRFFGSTLAQTYPNRRFLMSRHRPTAMISTSIANFSVPANNGTIFDRLDRHRISWRNYYTDLPGHADRPGPVHARAPREAREDRPVLHGRGGGKLPAVSFVDPHFETSPRRTRRTSSSASSSWPR